jgi:iron-sulfur cluster assembly protein
MSIHLTANAIERAKRFLAEQPRRAGSALWGQAHRLVPAGAIEIDVASEQAANDRVFEQDGVRVLVDALPGNLVDGTEIDFVKTGLNHQFVFRNPNAAAECGCGESFTTDER